MVARGEYIMVLENEVFDFWGIISNEVIGDLWLTIFLFIIAIIYATVLMKMPTEVQILFIILILAALFSQTLLLIIWVFVVMVVGLIFYWFLARAIGG